MAECSISHPGRARRPAVRREGCTGVKALPQETARLQTCQGLCKPQTLSPSMPACAGRGISLFSISMQQGSSSRGARLDSDMVSGDPSAPFTQGCCLSPHQGSERPSPRPSKHMLQKRKTSLMLHLQYPAPETLLSISITGIHVSNNHPRETFCTSHQNQCLIIISDIWETCSSLFLVTMPTSQKFAKKIG